MEEGLQLGGCLEKGYVDSQLEAHGRAVVGGGAMLSWLTDCGQCRLEGQVPGAPASKPPATPVPARPPLTPPPLTSPTL